MGTVTVGPDGTIPLPETVRAQAGLKPGDQVDVVVGVHGEVRITARKVRLEDLYGILAPANRAGVLSVEEMNDAIAEAGTRR